MRTHESDVPTMPASARGPATHGDAADAGDARPRTAGELRRFAWSVGGVLALLAAVAAWRGRPVAAAVAALPAALLLLAGVAAPARLAPVERAWMRGALAISRVTTPIFMGAVYLLALTPLGLARRALGRGLLAGRGAPGSRWVERPAGERRSDLRRQF